MGISDTIHIRSVLRIMLQAFYTFSWFSPTSFFSLGVIFVSDSSMKNVNSHANEQKRSSQVFLFFSSCEKFQDIQAELIPNNFRNMY